MQVMLFNLLRMTKLLLGRRKLVHLDQIPLKVMYCLPLETPVKKWKPVEHMFKVFVWQFDCEYTWLP